MPSRATTLSCAENARFRHGQRAYGRCMKRGQLSRSRRPKGPLLVNWPRVCEHTVKWAGNPVEIERACEKARILRLPAGSGSHEPVKLLAGASPLLCGLLLESPE